MDFSATQICESGAAMIRYLARWRARRKMRWAVRMLEPSHGEPLYRKKLKAVIRAQRVAKVAMQELNRHPSLSGRE